MPKSSKASRKNNRTRKFVAKKGLVGGNLIDEAKRFLEFKGISRTELIDMLGKNPNGSLKRGAKNIGPFKFTVERSQVARGVLSETAFLYVNYKDGAQRDAVQL